MDGYNRKPLQSKGKDKDNFVYSFFKSMQKKRSNQIKPISRIAIFKNKHHGGEAQHVIDIHTAYALYMKEMETE